MWVVLGEMFPNKIRSLGLGIATAFNWIFNFLVTLLFPILSQAVGLGFVYAGLLSSRRSPSGWSRLSCRRRRASNSKTSRSSFDGRPLLHPGSGSWLDECRHLTPPVAIRSRCGFVHTRWACRARVQVSAARTGVPA
jgi:hypothetical protein